MNITEVKYCSARVMHSLLCLFLAQKKKTSPDLTIGEMDFSDEYGISVSSTRSLKTESWIWKQLKAFQTCLYLGLFPSA